MLNKIREEVKDFIKNNVGIDVSIINMQHSFEEYEIDSILLIKLIVHMEEKFKISYEDKILLEEYASIEDFVTYTYGLSLQQ